MKMKKRILWLIVALIAAAAFGGCSAAQPAEASSESASAASASPAVREAESTSSPAASESEAAPSPEPVQSGGVKPLRVEGTKLLDSDGNEVVLKGISTHGLSWFPQYVNEEAFAQLKEDWGANVIRLAMYTAESGGYCTDGDPQALKLLVEEGVHYAQDNDLYAIIDWHILSDADPNIYKDQAIAFFDEMSAKYARQPNVIYEICNEPNNGTSWEQIKSYAEEVIAAIRANDEDAVILVGTPNWSQYVDEAAADPITGYDNIMYTLHFYAATHKEDLRNRLESAVEAGLPIFVSEFSICDASGNGGIDYDSTQEWLALLDREGISRVMWNLSNKDETSSLIASASGKTSGFTEEDLSETGRWAVEVMLGGKPLSSAAAEETEDADPSKAAETQESSAADDGLVTVQNGAIQASARLANSWDENGTPVYQYTVTVKNTGEQSVSSWKIAFALSGDPEISDSWNGSFQIQDDTLVITNADYNGSINAGGSAADVGVIIKGGRMAP